MSDDNPEQEVSDEELEEQYSGGESSPSASEKEPTYTVEVNSRRYSLNEEVRHRLQERARSEYRENEMFTCFWKVASPDQYAEGGWQETIHEAGDPVLVIETEGPMVPWERLDTLDVEMQQADPDAGFDGLDSGSDDTSGSDNGNGVRMISPGDDDDSGDDPDMEIGRTHFGLTPEDFEKIPDPDGEDADKIPAKPLEMGDDPALIAWVPDHPEIEHTWAAGEAICPMYNRVEWNVQKKADQPSPTKNKDNLHDRWESMLRSHGCEVVAELGPSQDVPSDESAAVEEVPDDAPDHFEEGKYNGNNWQI